MTEKTAEENNDSTLHSGVIRKEESTFRSIVLALALGIPILLLYLVPYFNGDVDSADFLFSTIAQICIFAAVGLTLNLEAGFLGLPNFGKVAFLAVAGYSYYFGYTFMYQATSHLEVSVIFGIVIASISTGLTGVLLTLPSLRLKEDYFAIVTIVAGEILRMVLINEPERLGGPSGFKVTIPFLQIFEKEYMKEQFITVTKLLVALVYIAIVTFRIHQIYMGEKKKGPSVNAIKNSLSKGTTFAVLLGLLGSLLNMESVFGLPSWGLDLFFLLTPLGLVVYERIMDSHTPKTVMLGGVASLFVLALLDFFLGLVIDVQLPVDYAAWYNALMSYYMLMVVYFSLREVISSPFGRTIRAIREDDTSALSVGKGLFMYRLKGLVISSTLTGFVGVFFAYALFSITPYAYLPTITFLIYIMVIIGGTANNKGVIYGATVFTLLKLGTSQLLDYRDKFPSYPWDASIRPDPSNIAQILIGLLLIIFLIFGPKGVFPERQYNNQKYYDYLYLADESIEEMDGNALLQQLLKLTGAKLPVGEAILDISTIRELKDTDYVFEGRDVYKYFGGVKALQGATVLLQKGKLTSLIGPNGSGKSTFFNVVTGFLAADEDKGVIRFYGGDIKGEKPENIAHMGMVRTFQHTRNFPKLTVLENMLVSPQDQVGESIVWSVFAKPLWSRQEARYVQRALHILKFLEIDHVADHLADELSGGQQKLLAIGRLLMTQPSLLMLDEPVAGVNPTLANKIFDRIIELKNTQGIDILLIEHNMDVVMSFSDEIFVLADGKVIAQGDSAHIQENKLVLDAYLGESPDEA